jgi:hypothetical protein
MVSSGMLRRVDLVRTDVSEEFSDSFTKVTRICELRTTLAATSNRRTLIFLRSVRRLLVAAIVPSSPILVTLMKESLNSSETSVLTRATRRNIPEDTIFHSHRREDLNLANVDFSGIFIQTCRSLRTPTIDYYSGTYKAPFHFASCPKSPQALGPHLCLVCLSHLANGVWRTLTIVIQREWFSEKPLSRLSASIAILFAYQKWALT